MRVAMVGDTSFGGVRMRGVQVALQNGWEMIDLADLATKPKYDVLILVKYAGGFADLIRSKCRRLIFDPLDCWAGRDEDPKSFWARLRSEIGFDDIIATSPACAESMPGRVHLIPHHADVRILPERNDPSGPVVYIGDERYIRDGIQPIRAACEKLRRQLLIGTHPVMLHGASVALAPRLGRSSTEINRRCKPCVKVENAAAASVPVLATDDPAITSLYGITSVVAHSVWADPVELAASIRSASVVEHRYSIAETAATLDRIVRCV